MRMDVKYSICMVGVLFPDNKATVPLQESLIGRIDRQKVARVGCSHAAQPRWVGRSRCLDDEQTYDTHTEIRNGLTVST